MTTLPRAALRALFRATPRPLRHFLRDRLLPEPLAARIRGAVAVDPPPPDDRRAHELEAKLWGGFSEQALADLEALKLHPATGAADVSYAAWALARWHFLRGDFARARDDIALMRLADRSHPHKVAQPLLEAACLMALDRAEEARSVLDHARQGREDDPHLALAMANSFARPDGARDEQRLTWINRVLLAAGLAPLERRDRSAPLGLDNLVAAPICGLTPPDRQPRVSVLMPVHTAEDTLPVALDSLLAQTWRNLEIIVVDDCSLDSTFALAQRYAVQDGRVTALRQDTNRGAYAARNRALAEARGDLITVHDADDWSHPQKIEIQARHLMETPEAAANMTGWVRSTPAMCLRGTALPTGNMIHRNYSSLMLRCETLRAMGGWDEVRVGADAELLRRLEYAYGPEAVVDLLAEAPLAFGRVEADSLTQQAATHLNTHHHGVRREYREAADHWRAQLGEAFPRLSRDGRARAFPAPGFIRPERVARAEFDLLVVADFNHDDTVGAQALREIAAAHAAGQTVGAFHWRHYEADAARPLGDALRRMAQAGRVTIVAPGEAVTAAEVRAIHPAALQHAIDLPVKLNCSRFVIEATAGGVDAAYDRARVEANIVRLFGIRPLWGASPHRPDAASLPEAALR